MRGERSAVSRILVPTDFSDCSVAALDYAVALAKPFNADLILVHVIEPFPYNVIDGLTFVDYGARLASETQALLDRLSKRALKEKLSVATRLTEGIPFREIINMAKREKADLIVIGTHGRTGMTHLITGSVAERVVRLAPCPVVTVRMQAPVLPPKKAGRGRSVKK
ncbi:MAG TPA: universal stress protein [Candidatus Manganitrophaceae bacterium]|nr:universal stress protein [Candidatus Manganitrophaceae bacterium]